MSPRPFLAIGALVFVAGAIVLEFLVVLAGAVNGTPLSGVWFLEADTSNIQGASSISRWTYWNSCGPSDNGNNVICSVSPAYPFDPQNNFGSQQGIPSAFLGTNKFFYETRFMFAFALISLVFSAASLALGGLALCSRIGSYLSSTAALVAVIFQTLTAGLMTAAFVEGRNIFEANGRAAVLGRYSFGFNWAAVAALTIAVVLFCVGGATSRDSGRRSRSAKNRGSFIDGDASSFTRA